MTPETFRRRRAALSALCPSWTILLPAAARVPRLPTTTHPYAPDANLVYLTGHAEPGAMLVLRPGGDAILYAPEPDPKHIRWSGPMAALATIAQRAGLDDVRPASRFDDDLAEHLRAGAVVGHRLGIHPMLDARVIDTLHRVSTRHDGKSLRPIHDPRGPLGRLRLRKDEGELALLRASAVLTTEAHRRLRESARAGDTGLALAGRFEATCREGGAERMAYETIVARGEEATCLHARPTRTPIRAGELVLVDAGAELDGYACDVTRTWPMGGFDDGRAALYDAVLDAQRAALGAIRPGTTLDAIHDVAKSSLAEGLGGLGLPVDVDRFFPHGTSHWLGLDVHDAGSTVESDGAPVLLEPGMVFTVEPGLYIDAEASDVPPALRGTGVRIEDTVAVTTDGVEILTATMPK
jgi:Xaa-Pro aminopeptidase